MKASGEGFPVLDGAVLPDVLSLDVGVGREEGREDGGLCPLVDGERALKQHMSTLEGGGVLHGCFKLLLCYSSAFGITFVCFVLGLRQKQNTQNISHKRMNNGVFGYYLEI